MHIAAAAVAVDRAGRVLLVEDCHEGERHFAPAPEGVELRPDLSEVLGAGWWDPRHLPQPRRTITSAALGDALAGIRGVYREV